LLNIDPVNPRNFVFVAGAERENNQGKAINEQAFHLVCFCVGE